MNRDGANLPDEEQVDWENLFDLVEG